MSNKYIVTSFKLDAKDEASATLAKVQAAFKSLESASNKDYSKGLKSLNGAIADASVRVKHYKAAVDELAAAKNKLGNYQQGMYGDLNIVKNHPETALLVEKKLIAEVTAAQEKLNKVKQRYTIPDNWKNTLENSSVANANKKASNGYGMSGTTQLIAAGAIFGAGAEIIKMADEYKMLQSRISLASASTAEYTQANKDLLEIANTNGQSLEATALLYNRIRQGIKDLGGTYEDAKSSVSAVGAALRISGASALEAYSAQLQFSQALASGKLRGDELRSVMENAPALAKALANGLNVPIGKLYELGEAGSLTTKMVIDALKTQEAELTKQAATMPLTIGQSFQVLKNNLEQYIGKLDQSIGLTNLISKGLQTLAKNVDTVIPALAGLGAALSTMIALSVAWASRAAIMAAAAASLGSVLTGLAAMLSVPGLALLGISTAIGLYVKNSADASSKQKTELQNLRKELQDFNKDIEKIIAKGTLVERLNEKQAISNKLGSVSDQIQRAITDKMTLESQIANSVNIVANKSRRESVDLLQEKINTLTKERMELEKAKLDLEDSLNQNSQASIIVTRSKSGADKLDSTGGVFGDKSLIERINEADNAWNLFAKNTKTNSGDVAMSFGEIRIIFDKLVEEVSNSEIGNVLENKFAQLESRATGEAKTYLQSARSKLSKKIEDVANKENDESIGIIAAKLEALKNVQQSIIDNTSILTKSSIDFKTVMAEIKMNARDLIELNILGTKNDINTAKSKYAGEIASIDSLYSSKIKLANLDKDIQLKSKDEARTKTLAERDKELASLTTKSEEDRFIIQDKYAKKLIQIEQNKVAVHQSTADKVGIIERETLASRIKALTEYRDNLVSKSNEALQSYKTFAQKVIDLDKAIRDNRLNTASDVENIKRKGMTPGQLQDSYRSEYDQYGNLAQQYSSNNDFEKAKEYLQRQREIANNLAGTSDSKDIQAEAISMLEEVGSKTEKILQYERETAQSAASEQMAVYEQLNSTIQKLGEQITSLNENSVINLKAKLDESSIAGVVQSIQDALNSRVFTFNAVASNVSVNGNAPTPGFATGGFISGPGTGTSDSIPIMASNGEYMIRAAAVRKFGVGFFNAINHGMHIPKFATGGLIGAISGSTGSVNNYIQMPSGEYTKVPSNVNEVDAFQAKLAREKIKRGSR